MISSHTVPLIPGTYLGWGCSPNTNFLFRPGAIKRRPKFFLICFMAGLGERAARKILVGEVFEFPKSKLTLSSIGPDNSNILKLANVKTCQC